MPYQQKWEKKCKLNTLVKKTFKIFKTNLNFFLSSNGSLSSTSSNCKLRSLNTNLEWAKLVKTASKAFENAHKNAENSGNSSIEYQNSIINQNI